MQIGKNDYNTFCKNKFVNMFNMKRKLCAFIDTTVTCMDCVYTCKYAILAYTYLTCRQTILRTHKNVYAIFNPLSVEFRV